MPIQMVKCKKHGLCRAEVVYSCKACASEKKAEAPCASDNTGSPKLLDDLTRALGYLEGK